MCVDKREVWPSEIISSSPGRVCAGVQLILALMSHSQHSMLGEMTFLNYN